MSISSYICENCSKFGICKWNDVIKKFHEDAKQQILVDIEIKSCKEFLSA